MEAQGKENVPRECVVLYRRSNVIGLVDSYLAPSLLADLNFGGSKKYSVKPAENLDRESYSKQKNYIFLLGFKKNLVGVIEENEASKLVLALGANKFNHYSISPMTLENAS